MTAKHSKKPSGKHSGHHYIDTNRNIGHSTDIYQWVIHRLFGLRENPDYICKCGHLWGSHFPSTKPLDFSHPCYLCDCPDYRPIPKSQMKRFLGPEVCL